MKNKLFLLILIISTFLGCKKEESEKKSFSVKTAIIKKASKYIDYEYPALVVASKENPVSFRVPGVIEDMNVDNGQFLKKGETIAKLDSRDYQTTIRATKKRLDASKNVYEASKAISENAKKQYERVNKLYETKSISKKDYDNALAAMKSTYSSELAALSTYQSIQNELKITKDKLKDTTLKAPYSGYVAYKFLEEGSVVIPGTPVVKMSSKNKSQVEINMSKKDLKMLTSLKESNLIINKKTYPLKLKTVSKVMGITKVSYPVYFTFTDNTAPLLDSNGTVRLSYKNTSEASSIAPIASIFEDGGSKKVWVYNNGKVFSKKVSDITPYKKDLVIIKGLNVGEKVVTRGVHGLSEGQEVRLYKESSKANIGDVL